MISVPTQSAPNGYITRGEFVQFERRMDGRFDVLAVEITKLRADVLAIVVQDKQSAWFGPRIWLLFKLGTPAVIGALTAWLLTQQVG